MADEDTARTLILIGAILQVLFTIGVFIIGGFALFGVIIGIGFDPDLLWLLFLPAFFIVGAVISLIFCILWFSWRHEPGAHRAGLIVTGILALIFGGFLPGLLVLIGGAIAPSEAA